MTVDFFGVLAPMIRGKASLRHMTTAWSNGWGASLASAANGGQWTQIRKCAVKAWGITDNRCQLCFAAPGTTQHRRHCTVTAPARSKQPIPKDAKIAAQRISNERLDLLTERGVLALKLPQPPVRKDGTFQWILNPLSPPERARRRNVVHRREFSMR